MTHRRRRSLNLVLLALAALVLVIALAHRKHSPCRTQALPALTAASAGAWLEAALTEVPCPATQRTVYDLRDAQGEPMDVLDPVADPAGGYLGVYHTPVSAGQSQSARGYRVSLARSGDLVHWTGVRVLDPVGASMPTLWTLPGPHPGFLLAYEKNQLGADFIRVRFYRSLAGLLAGRWSNSTDLPVRLSPLGNGTPSFLSVDWRGGPARSVITLAFHYESRSAAGDPGPDREAVGVLTGFRRWSARPDPQIDQVLSAAGLTGNHGDLRQFRFEGQLWRVYEAQARSGDFSSWHVVLLGVSHPSVTPLRLRLARGQAETSFGNPVVRVLPAPGGRGQVLVATVFVFGSGQAARSAGELLWLQPF